MGETCQEACKGAEDEGGGGRRRKLRRRKLRGGATSGGNEGARRRHLDKHSEERARECPKHLRTLT